jgi:hypothetical protein
MEFFVKFHRQIPLRPTGRRALSSNLSNLDVEQLTGIFFHEAFDVIGIGLCQDGVEASVQPVEAAAIVGTENHVVFAHLVD